MNITQNMERIDTAEHLSDVKARMAIMQNTSIVQESAEITTRHVFHGEVDLRIILESVEELHEPIALGRRENIALGKNVTDFIEFEEQFLAHHLQCAHFARVLLLRQIHLSIATLADLSQNLEVTLAETCATLAQMGTFATEVFKEGGFVLFFWNSGRIGIGGFELGMAGLNWAWRVWRLWT